MAIRACIFDYSGTLGERGILYEDAGALLTWLRERSVRIGLLTRTNVENIRRSGLPAFVDIVVTDSVKDDAAFAALARDLDADLAATLIIGDGWDLEIASAQRLHAPWVHIDALCETPTQMEERGWRVSSLTALLTLLQNDALGAFRPSNEGAPSPRPE